MDALVKGGLIQKKVKLGLGLGFGLFVVACSNTPYIKTTMVSTNEASVAGIENKPIEARLVQIKDPAMPLSIAERIKPHGFSLGAWINRSEGLLFKPVPTQGENVALVYMYRPNSKWNFQEIIAPSFFLNGQRLNSLRNNQYYWLEMPAGVYQLSIRRPVGNIYFQKGTLVNFKVDAGKRYFLRYDEEGTRGKVDPALGLLSAGPISQVPESVALPEIAQTTLNTPGYTFVPLPDALHAADFNSFTGKKANSVPSSRLQTKEDVVLGVPLKIWNPLTW